MMQKNSILFIACDELLADIYGRKLEAEGFDVEIATSIDEGDKKLLKLRPSILLLDTECTVDIAEEIKRFRKMPTILKAKIVVLSPSGHKDQIRMAKKAGADTFLIQGHFSPAEIVKKMKKLLEA